jgi:hypothetical protein
MPEPIISFPDLVNSPEYQSWAPERRAFAVNKWTNARIRSVGDKEMRGQIAHIFKEQHAGGMDPAQNEQFISMMMLPDEKSDMQSTIDSAKRAASGFVDAAAGLSAWAGVDDLSDQLTIQAQKLALNAQVAPSVAEEVGQFDMGDLVKKDFWTSKGAEQIFVNLPFMASGFGTSAVLAKGAQAGMKGVVTAAAGGSAVMTTQEALFEAGTAYNEALQATGDNERAGEVAYNVFWNNAALLGTTNTAELAATLTLGKFIPKAVRGSFKDWLKASSVLLAGGTLEGAQEVVQKYYTDAAMEWAKGEREDSPSFVPDLGQVMDILGTPDGREAFVMGFLMQAGASAAPGAMKTADSVLDRLKTGKMTPEEAAIELLEVREEVAAMTDQQLSDAAMVAGTVLPEGATREQQEEALTSDIRTTRAQEASAAQAQPIAEPSEAVQGAIKEVQTESDVLADIDLVPVQDTEEMARYRNALEKVTESEIVLVQGSQDLPFNGYTAKDGTILIDARSDQPFRHVIAHELTHDLRKQQPDLYREIAELSEGHTSFLKSVNQAREAQGYRPLTAEEIKEETAAEFVQANILEPKFWRRLAKGSTDTSAGKKAGMITRLLRKVTARMPVDAPGMQELLQTQDKLQDIFTRWAQSPRPEPAPTAAAPTAAESTPVEPAVDKAPPLDADTSAPPKPKEKPKDPAKEKPKDPPKEKPKDPAKKKPKEKGKWKPRQFTGAPGWLNTSKPLYITRNLDWQDPIDKAVYLATSRRQSKGKEAREYLRSRGIEGADVLKRGRDLRKALKSQAAKTEGVIDVPSGGKFSISRRAIVDARYMELAKEPQKNSAVLRRMVDEAAKRAEWFRNSQVVDDNGDPLRVYHGTDRGADIRKFKGVTNWWTPKKEFADDYAQHRDWERSQGKGTVDTYEAYLSAKSLLEVRRSNIERTAREFATEALNAAYEDGLISQPLDKAFVSRAKNTINNLDDTQKLPLWTHWDLNVELIDFFKEIGYDGIKSKENVNTTYGVFDPSQIKSADPVTYDNAGNVIPLSERFQVSKEDIRFSISRRAIVDKTVHRVLKGDKGPAPAPGNLAIPVESEALRNAFQILDQARAENEPEVRKRSIARQEAIEQIGAEGEIAVRERLINEGTSTDTDVFQYHFLLNEEGAEALTGNNGNRDGALMRKWVQLANEYRDDGRRMATAFAARADIYETPAERAKGTVMKAILHPDKAIDNQIDNAKDVIDSPEATPAQKDEATSRLEELLDEQVQAIKDLLAYLEEHNLNLEDIDWVNPESSLEVIRTIRGYKATTADKIYEFWMNSILSGPKTHAANTLGTTYAIYNGIIVRGFEAMVNGVTGNNIEGATTMEEMRHTWKGLSNGIGDASRNAMLAFKTEQPAFGLSFAKDASTKLEKEYAPGAISGKKGRIIRVPTRVLVATDEFFKTLFWNGMVGAMAHRSGKALNLSGKALEDHIGNKVADKQSAEAQAALEWSKDALFQDEKIRNLPGWSQVLQTADNLRKVEDSKWPALNWFFRYLVPFVTTPSNLARIGIGRLTPMGIPIGVWKAVNTYRVNKHGKGNQSWVYSSRADVVHDVFNQVLVTAGFMTLAGMIDEEDPFITGSSATRGKPGRSDLESRLMPAMSVGIPGTDMKYSYRRLDPIASSLAAMVDAILAMKKLGRGVDADRVFSDWTRSQTASLSDKTYLKAVGDLIVGIQLSKYGLAGGLERWGTSFAGSFWPAAFRHAALASDDEVRQLRRAPESGVTGWAGEVAGRAFRLPFGPPKRDPWGRPIKKNGSGVVTGIGRFLSPTLAVDTGQATNLDRMLHAWNFKHEGNADMEYWVPVPEPKFKFQKQEYVLTKQEYDDFIRIRGELMLEYYPQLPDTRYDSPTELDIARLKKLEIRAKRHAKIQIIKQRRAEDAN